MYQIRWMGDGREGVGVEELGEGLWKMIEGVRRLGWVKGRFASSWSW